jgi:hypothetical protein
MPTLTIQLPGLPPVEHVLREEAITLGRMKGNTIALDDVSISLSHAKITRLGDDYFLKDLNSTNGTLLNGQSINEARLRDGDRLKFGEVQAVFRMEPFIPAATPARTVTAEPAPQATAQSLATSLPAAAPTRPAAPVVAPAPAAAPRPVPTKPPVPWTTWVGVFGGLAAVATLSFIGWQMLRTQSNQPTAPAVAPAKSAEAKPTAPTATSVAPTEPEPAEAEPADNRSAGELMTALDHRDPAERRRAAKRLSTLATGTRDALPALRQRLTDADPEVQMWSALALVNNQSYDPAAVPILVRTLRHDNATYRQLACISLALFEYDDAERATVLSALQTVAAQDDNADVRRDAQTAVKYLSPEPAAR